MSPVQPVKKPNRMVSGTFSFEERACLMAPNAVFFINGSSVYLLKWFRKKATPITNNATDITPEITPTPNAELVVYPNPTNGYITLKTLHAIDNLEVLDAKGTVVNISGNKLQPNDANTYTLNLTNQKQGLYLIKITSNHQVFSKKLVLNNN